MIHIELNILDAQLFGEQDGLVGQLVELPHGKPHGQLVKVGHRWV